MRVSPPSSQQQLIDRALQLSGCSLQQIADRFACNVPTDTRHAKGWVGNLLEQALGASAGALPEPDFMTLGIELKTLPIDHNSKPKESTYVCVVQLDPESLANWERSLVRKKLAHVLWIPYEASKTIPLPARRIGNPILWQPDKDQEQQLLADWQEFSDMIVMGEIDKISSSLGKVLQIRPKAAHARVLTVDKNSADADNTTLPRGFYLRTAFTQKIIEKAGY